MPFDMGTVCRRFLTAAVVHALFSIGVAASETDLSSSVNGGVLLSLPLYGNIGIEYGYYFLDAMVGTPPQRVSVILELSSNILAFPCTECTSCGSHLDPSFRLNSSQSAVQVPCGRPGSPCEFQQDFTEGSVLKGFLFYDYVYLRGLDEHQTEPSKLQIGCITSETALFHDQQANGVLGLARGRQKGSKHISLTEQLLQDRFSLCLSTWGGQLTIGGFNQSFHTAPASAVDFSDEQGMISLILQGTYVDGKRVAACNRAVLLDMGTTLTYFDSATYRSLTSAIESHCEGVGKCGHRVGPCWKLSSHDIGAFPEISFQLGGVQIRWSPSSYLLRHGSWKDHACYAFDDDGQRASIVLGASWMVNRDVLFDFKKKQLILADARCPEHRVRRTCGDTASDARHGSVTSPPRGGPMSATVPPNHREGGSEALPPIDVEKLAMQGLALLVSARRTSKPADFPEGGDGNVRPPPRAVDRHWHSHFPLAIFGIVLLGGICFGMAMGAVCHAQLLRGEAREPLLGQHAGEFAGGESLEWELPSLPPLVPRQPSPQLLRPESDGI
mmetsp:Transcript_11948/g.27926  ORF Transcript_11948/g.27926 Transcript_11948/m.27926 type:complete len:556 (+) Transcript_11948:102-1769(+)